MSSYAVKDFRDCVRAIFTDKHDAMKYANQYEGTKVVIASNVAFDVEELPIYENRKKEITHHG